VVPQPAVLLAPGGEGVRCQPAAPTPVPPRFTPILKERPLTQATPFDPASASAAASLSRPVAPALPAIVLTGTVDGKPSLWTPVRDLLNSRADDHEFVVEVENDLSAAIRFGDDQHGQRPDSGTVFSATYRVGNGARGNIGADALVHFVAAPDVAGAIASVRNPLAAVGGAEPENLEDVRQRAPSAFRTQERAVTTADYAEVTERNPQIQQAAATLRWTGSWRTVFITPDRVGGAEVDTGFRQDLRRFVEPYRMAGQDLEIDAPRPVALEITLRVCVKPNHFRSDVKAALLQVFSKRTLPDGRRGVFHPDNFTFGQPVYLSRIYAAAQAVDGVASADATQFERQGRSDPQAFADGVLKFARLEIPRLDNDPNFPERGVFHLIMEGGK
jgi:predicted phage baseplate assembly protein